MPTTIPIKDCGKGLNLDAPAADLELGVFSGSTKNWRFANGVAERWDGVDTVFTGTSRPSWIMSYKPAATRYLVYAGTAAIARTPAGVSSTITRTKVEQTILTNTRIGANTAEVTTAVAHGLATNDNVTVYGAVESGYNETNTNITVMSPTVFRYTTTNAIGLNATVPGSYVVTESTTTSSFTSSPNAISGGILSGVLLMNNPTDGLFWWAGDTAQKFQKFAFPTYLADACRVFGNYIVQLGATMSGTKYSRRVLWSSAAEPGAVPTSFDASSTNDAGFVDLTGEDGILVDCLPYGNANIIFSESGRYAQRLIPGSAEVFSFTRLPGSDGLLSLNCIANTPKGQVFLTPTFDVRIHQGGESASLTTGRVRSGILSDIAASSGLRSKSFLCVNPRKEEVWVVFTVGNRQNVIYAWNWVSDTWSRYRPTYPSATATGALCAHTGLYPTSVSYTTDEEAVLIVANDDDEIGVAGGTLTGSGGGDWFTESYTATLEATGVHLDDLETFKTPDGLMMNADATAAATATCYLGTAKTADAAPTYTSGGTYTHNTSKFVDQRATAGPFMAMKVETTAHPFRVRSMALRVSGGGKR